MERNFSISFADLKRYWLDLLDNRVRSQQADLTDRMANWRSQDARQEATRGRRSSWEGGTGYEMRQWIRDGFQSKEFDAIDDMTPAAKKRRVLWSEEGDEMDIAKVWSGDPTPFSQMEQREAKPGLKIVVDMSMSASTDSSVVEQYGAWVAGFSAGMESKGYDLEVDATIHTHDMMTVERRGGRNLTRCIIHLKELNQQTDFASWSPMFSPGGFRILGFTALNMAADDAGKQAASHLGTPNIRSEWAVRWDAQDRTLYIDSPNAAREFDGDKLTKLVKDSGFK